MHHNNRILGGRNEWERTTTWSYSARLVASSAFWEGLLDNIFAFVVKGLQILLWYANFAWLTSHRMGCPTDRTRIGSSFVVPPAHSQGLVLFQQQPSALSVLKNISINIHSCRNLSPLTHRIAFDTQNLLAQVVCFLQTGFLRQTVPFRDKVIDLR